MTSLDITNGLRTAVTRLRAFWEWYDAIPPVRKIHAALGQVRESDSALATLTDSAKTIIFIGILIAAWGKSAQLPFHFWLPDAMVAPTPISAYLHAASMVKVGVYIFARGLISAGSVRS